MGPRGRTLPCCMRPEGLIFGIHCWTFCHLHAAIVPWQALQIPLHSNAGTVKRPFELHEQSPVVVQLAIVRTTAVLEGPLQVGPIKFLEIAPKGLVHFRYNYSTVFYEIL